ncbi:fibronectin type III-like domain-contianing protein [Streptomyces montanus]|uniref:fibronectin type III-like domain-contianing protein n=1 Tax=Streptomyces montanus TaxID=2580423 RepID=UPI001FE9F2D1|nr:fibronectin type III-like domain-contianing protein [Streptomyces montanus]
MGRSQEKTAAVAADAGGRAHLADFAPLDSVRGLAADLPTAYDRIGILANNAGAMFADHRTSVDGHEMSFQVNHLSPFLLTNLLLDRPTTPMGVDAPTILDAIRQEFPGAAVRHEPGCPVTGEDRSGIEAGDRGRDGRSDGSRRRRPLRDVRGGDVGRGMRRRRAHARECRTTWWRPSSTPRGGPCSSSCRAARTPSAGTPAGHVPGTLAGTAVPQLYLTDPVASVTRPVCQLIGFTRVDLAARESRVVEFQVYMDMTGFTGRDLRRRVEPGGITLTVAQSAGDRGSSVQVRLEGDIRTVDHTRTMTTAVTVRRDGSR